MRRPVLTALLVTLAMLGTAAPARAQSDPGLQQQWHLQKIGAEAAWSSGIGHGITIGVVDSGVDLEHEDLAKNVLPGRNFVIDGNSAQDDHGHGTHVAGLAAALVDNGRGVAGVAPAARILPVKVLGSQGGGSEANIGAGIRWAVDNGATVVNVSLGVETQFRPDDQTTVAVPRPSAPVISAIRYAWNKGVICVMAAGNDDNAMSVYSAESALVVGATDKDDRLASYSSQVGAAKWGLVAPGGAGSDTAEENILSTYWVKEAKNSYAWGAGTSMAAPQVAGAAAVLRGLGLNAQQTVDRLLQSAKDLGPSGRDTAFGYGRLDVAKAVAGLQPAPTRRTAAAAGTGSTTTTTLSKRTTATTRNGGSDADGSPSGSGSATPTTTAGSPLVVVDESVPPRADGERDEEFGAGSTAGGASDTGDDGLPLLPPLVATALWGATVAGWRRARRV